MFGIEPYYWLISVILVGTNVPVPVQFTSFYHQQPADPLQGCFVQNYHTNEVWQLKASDKFQNHSVEDWWINQETNDCQGNIFVFTIKKRVVTTIDCLLISYSRLFIPSGHTKLRFECQCEGDEWTVGVARAA